MDSFPFDYAALPALEPIALDADLESAWLRFVPGMDGPELRMPGRLVAEIEIGTYPTPHEENDSGSLIEPIPAKPHRFYHLFRQVDATGPLAWTPAGGAGHLCGGRSAPSRARWQGYLHDSRTPEGLVFVCYEGDVDPRTCIAKAEHAWRVVARPIVGTALYGFRVQQGDCGPPGPPREERLTLIGPRPMWIGSTSPLSLHEPQGQRSFTRIVVPVARSISASAVVDVRQGDLRLFGASPPDSPLTMAEVLSYSVEIVWPRSAPAPSAVGFLSIISGNTEGMSQRALQGISRR